MDHQAAHHDVVRAIERVERLGDPSEKAQLATRANGVRVRWRALARSAERAVDDQFAQGALEDRELLIIELRDEQIRDTARVDRGGLC
jgi:hypothetical protein